MEALTILKMLLLFAHLLAFAVSAGYILREDLRFIRSHEIRMDQLRETAWVVTRALGILWFTGIVMILIDTAGDLSVLATKPKLLAKLTVVSVLTINGWLLHHIAFPTLSGSKRRPASARVAAIIGAVSGTSWMYAAFVGIAKPVAPMLGYTGFIALYLALLCGATIFALLILRPRLERVMHLAAI